MAITNRRTFKLSGRVSAEGLPFLDHAPCSFGSDSKKNTRYACIGAVLMSKQVADGIRDKNGFWKHGHTYQVC